VSLFALIVIIALPLLAFSLHAHLVTRAVVVMTAAAFAHFAYAHSIIAVPSLWAMRVMTAGSLCVGLATFAIIIAVLTLWALAVIVATFRIAIPVVPSLHVGPCWYILQ